MDRTTNTDRLIQQMNKKGDRNCSTAQYLQAWQNHEAGYITPGLDEHKPG